MRVVQGGAKGREAVIKSATMNQVRSQKYSVTSALMMRLTRLSMARFLAMLAIVLKVFLPGSVAIAESSGLDVSRIMCVPSGEMSPETRAAAERIAKLFGGELPDEQSSGGDCPFCTLVHGVPLPEPIVIILPAAFPREQVFVRFEPGLTRLPQGPPLGSRGPPSHI